MAITDREKDILAAAEFILRKPENGARGYGEGWFKAMDVGGSNRSHHSQTLKRMVVKGWIEVKPQMSGTRWNRIYRITEAGLAQFKATFPNHRG